MKNKHFLIVLFALSLMSFLQSCKEQKDGPLPYLGQQSVENGKTIYHTVPEWHYLNTDSVMVTNKDLSDYVYVSDFFFVSCPSICPKVTKEMKRIYNAYKNDPRVKLVSFTIDPRHDSPERLKKYAKKLEVDTQKWWFLNTDENVYDIANAYFVAAYKADDVPGGFDHSGKIILVDKQGHIRSFSEGTDPETTPKLIHDIKVLLGEYEVEKEK